MLKCGDLFLIEQEQFKKSFRSFQDKWLPTTAATASSATGMEMVLVSAKAMATAIATAMATEMATVTNKTTGRQIKLKYYGHSFKLLTNNKIVGIVMEIFSEDNHDLDVIKFYDQGVIRYCRRGILEC